jgi:hypothetical protein
MASYSVMLRAFLAELDVTEQFKRETIIKLAQQLEKENFPVDKINDKIAEDVEPRISKSYVGKILEDKYKNKAKIHKKKKEQPIEIAVDGSVINPEEEEAKINAEEHEKFTEALNTAAEASSKQIESLDSMVLKELDTAREKLKQQEEIMEYIEENLGFYMVFDKNEDNILYVKMIDSEKANTSKELKIDLRRFEDNIKDSYKKGKYSAVIKHDGTKVTAWN